MLYNLVSGSPTSESLTESLMSLEENGLVLKHEFERRMIGTADKSSFCPIKKHQVFNFERTNNRDSGEERRKAEGNSLSTGCIGSSCVIILQVKIWN